MFQRGGEAFTLNENKVYMIKHFLNTNHQHHFIHWIYSLGEGHMVKFEVPLYLHKILCGIFHSENAYVAYKQYNSVSVSHAVSWNSLI